jgi:hypothetical protein
MATCALINSGEVTLTADPPESCAGYILIQPTDWTGSMLELIGVNSADIAQCFMWGFGTVIFFWFLGFCLSVALGLIRKA